MIFYKPTSSPPLLTLPTEEDCFLREGVYLSRPHRFVVRVYLEDEGEIEAHLPDPGRLHHLLQPGVLLQLQGPYFHRKTRYTALLVQTQEEIWVSLHTHFPSRLFPQLLMRGHLPWYPNPSDAIQIQAEVRHKTSRFDFLCVDPRDQSRRFVELKSVTWAENGRAKFPDAPTQRGRRHLQELLEWHRDGHLASLLFVVQRNDVQTFSPASSIDPAFTELLQQAFHEGLPLHALSVCMTPNSVSFSHALPLEFLP